MESLNYSIAKKRNRVFAFLVDFLIFWILGFIVGYFYGQPIEDELGFNLKGFPALIVFLFGFCLWPVSESLYGKTVGKRIFKLKVVSENHQIISFSQALTRFLLGFVDYIFLLGLIVASSNKKNQRIGDLVAKTIIIQEN